VTAIQFVLFLHVMGAILAFGPTFAYSIIGGMGGKEPMHANFATRVTDRIGTRLVYPLAIFQGITGLALMLLLGITAPPLWLAIGIVLYIIALVYALTIQRNAVHRIIELSSAPPPPGATVPAALAPIPLNPVFKKILDNAEGSA